MSAPPSEAPVLVGWLLGEMPGRLTPNGRGIIIDERCGLCGWNQRLVEDAAGADWRDCPAWFIGDQLVVMVDSLDSHDFVVVAPMREDGRDGGRPCGVHHAGRASEIDCHIADLSRNREDTWGRASFFPVKDRPRGVSVCQ